MKFQISNLKFQIPNLKFWILNLKFEISNLKFQIISRGSALAWGCYGANSQTKKTGVMLAHHA
jgi:hypothetical protein